jgi:NAD(P)-dependent dehydrogenase (short-subunit alcohol dehydrogenase family)
MSVAVVTGGSRGFGRALAIDLAKDGWDLIIDGRDRASLQEVGATLANLGHRSTLIAGDVAIPDHRSALIEAAERFGSLDLLVNNASTLGPSPLPRLEGYPLAALRQVYEVNVIAPLALLQGALPLLRRSQGTVVCLSSDAAVEGYEGWGGYGSSKAALDQIHHVLAAEEPRLRVLQFDPGDMRTAMHQEAFPGEDISDRPEPESAVAPLRALLESDAPNGRYRAGDWVEQS